jgi:ribA/ribD-fused uncharacterized protein
MKPSCFRLLWLPFFLGGTAPILAQAADAPAASESAAPVKKPNWDDKFDGVVHDDKKIAGFVAEYSWLSNYFLCRVEWEAHVYGSSEAAYQAGKYPAPEREVFTKLDPDSARRLPRTKPYDNDAWQERKVRTMREIVWAKFSQNPELGKKLLATGERYLEETNWWGDDTWGVYQGRGENLLGKILMEVRERLTRVHAAAPEQAK